MILCTCLCIWARVCERARFLRLSGPKLLCFGLFHAWGTGGFLVKPRQTPGGMIHFWGDFSLSFSFSHGGGRSLKAAPGLGFSPVLSGGRPTFLFCGNLLSLDRENDCARPFIFPGWSLHPGSRSDRAGPGLGRGSGDGRSDIATLSEGGIQPQHISKPGSKGRGYARSGRKPTRRV